MEMKRLGKTDLNVSPLCLGTMQWGWTASEEQANATMDAFTAAGGNFIDTADIYSRWAKDNPGGVSEEIIGRWMKARGNRDSLVIATKVRGEMWEGKDGQGLSKSHIMRAAEDSLRRLQVETIDLYQCHYPDDRVPIEETLRAFEDLVKDGKVRYIGASNYTAELLDEAAQVSGDKSLPRFETDQPNYSLVKRDEFEEGARKACERLEMAVIPYSPLAAGFLTGKYRRGKTVRSQRKDRANAYMNDQGYGVLEAMDEISERRNAPLAAIALAWLLAQPTVAAPIVGANTPEQLADQLPAVGLKLSPEELESLATASAGM